MKTFYPIMAAALMASCAGIFPGSGLLAPHSPDGYEMYASGLDGSYEYEFKSDGTYLRKMILPSGVTTSGTGGTWKWQRQSGNRAVLTLDDDLEIQLHFTTGSHANATVPWSTRLFPVEFEKQ